MSKAPTVVSVINLKGGVGKTTVTALLARYAASTGLNVLAVDLDPQANLSQSLMGETEYLTFMNEQKPSIVELFNKFIPPSEDNPSPRPVRPDDFVIEVKYGYFHSRYQYKNNDSKLEILPSRFDFSDNLIRTTETDEKVLAKFIANHMQHKDLILIDCAPTESILTRASYHASRHVLIPVKTEFFSTIGFPLMQKSLDDFQDRNRGHNIDVCGVLVNRTETGGSMSSVDGRDSLEDIQQQALQYKWDVFEEMMNHSRGYPKWMRNLNLDLTGHPAAWLEWPEIAEEILAKIGLSEVTES